MDKTTGGGRKSRSTTNLWYNGSFLGFPGSGFKFLINGYCFFLIVTFGIFYLIDERASKR